MFNLAKPESNTKVKPAALGLTAGRLRHHIYNLVVLAFEREGISQKELATRLGKDTAHINRLLSAPGNWTIDTAAHLLYGINGNEMLVSEYDPSVAPLRNDVSLDWLSTREATSSSEDKGRRLPSSSSETSSGSVPTRWTQSAGYV